MQLAPVKLLANWTNDEGYSEKNQWILASPISELSVELSYHNINGRRIKSSKTINVQKIENFYLLQRKRLE